MAEIVDCRGLSCPEPVILARNALQKKGAGSVTVLVSNEVARDNVSRAAKALGWQVSITAEKDAYKLSMQK